jgi:DNA mismatch repair protein MutS2
MDNFLNAIEKLEFDKVRQRVKHYAASEPGRELIDAISISTSYEEIKAELLHVSELKRVLEEEGAFPLEGIHDIRDALWKSGIEGAALLPKQLWEILSTLRAARVARQFMEKRSSLYPAIWKIAESLHIDKLLEYNLDRVVDEAGSIRPNASAELQSIRRLIAERYEQLEKKLASILKNVTQLGFSQDEIITTRDGRMVIPVKAEHKNRVHGFIHSASASGATVFIEPSETLDLNNEIRSLQFQEQREIERILKLLTTQIGESRESLLTNLSILSKLDALAAKAKYSIEILGVEPEISYDGTLKLVQARHPLLLQAHGRDGTVPLDIELGGDYNTLIISGPNAGGKSVAMKTVGLLCLMVQSGLHIPAAASSVLRIFLQVFVDIGDDQSIENDLSTFSSHLRNLKAIDEQVSAESLVLIDEIGSGTDPAEGAAIAAALLASLSERNALTIATTHHSSLKVFANNTPRVENGAMEFNQANLTPTFRFKAGIPGSSYALEMAQRLGFKEETLSHAREFMGSHQAKIEHLITDLELAMQKYRNEMEAIQIEKTRLSELVTTYESKMARQATELSELKKRALDEAKGIVDGANAVIERSIKEIRERAADKESVKQSREALQNVRDEIERRQSELPPRTTCDRTALTVGDFVTLSGGIETGEIASITPDGAHAIVVFGNLKMKVPLKDLVKAQRKVTTMPRTVQLEANNTVEVLRDIDVRGLTSEEAIPLVDKFIDTAMLAGLHRVDIIHGKGTGALRKKITEFLSRHPRVKSYRLGEWNEGGTGATVVEIAEN